MFHGKGASINLARVLAFARPTALGVAEVLNTRSKLRVTLIDGSDVMIEGDEDTDGFISAMDEYLKLD